MHQLIFMLLASWLSSCNVLFYFLLIACVPTLYGVFGMICLFVLRLNVPVNNFSGGMIWDSTVSVPDHCFSHLLWLNYVIASWLPY